MKPYEPHPDREARRRSAVSLAEGILSLPGILPEHRKAALQIPAWLYTEADGKYSCRYRSARAMSEPSRKRLRHEHVVTRRHLVTAMMAQPERAAEILAGALSCIVTADEHERLGQVPDGAEGWERYRRAGIAVLDGATGRWLAECIS